MKYLVMENHESHSIVMDEAGLFHRVANLGYEIGDTVTEPIFMKTPEHKKKTDWKKISTIAAIFVCMLLGTIPFISNSTESDIVVYMSINPQIHLELNEDGKINKLVADNDDGKVLLEGYKYRGKSVSSVLVELIDRAENLKYLSEGGDIHITVEAENQTKAKTVEVDLSEVLKETYVKKYLIKIKANEEVFRDLDDVLHSGGTKASSAEEVTSEVETTESYYNYTEHYTEPTEQTTESSTESTTVPTTETQKPTTQPTESTKPTVKPTEKPTETTKPTEPPTEATTQPTSETEATTGTVDSGAGNDEGDDDLDWPWWPWPFKEY